MTQIEKLTQARDTAKRDLIAAYATRDDGRSVHLGYWEKRYTQACVALAAAELAAIEHTYGALRRHDPYLWYPDTKREAEPPSSPLMAYELGDEVQITDETVALGFDRYATIVSVRTAETDAYTVRFKDGLLRRINVNQIQSVVKCP